ncbi:MAG: iron-sulfur cluster repair di-iron protein [Candidatus Scalindua sp.]|nr:iron-sulfur cluster repair di-iron protein [Candidatus Scalindua sp.]
MSNQFNKDERIGKIVIDFPESAEIFMKHEIDFCCGGDRSVEVAITEDNPEVEVDAVLSEINEAYDNFLSEDYKQSDWESKSMTELLEFVENTHHAFMKKTLPITEELLLKIFKVHYSDDKDLLTEMYKLFMLLNLDINIHLIKEEEEFFPAIREYERTQDKDELKKVLKMISDAEDEHDAAGDILKSLRKLTNNYTLPEYGCTTFRIVYDKMQEIESDLFQHIHLENNLLFYKLKTEQ